MLQCTDFLLAKYTETVLEQAAADCQSHLEQLSSEPALVLIYLCTEPTLSDRFAAPLQLTWCRY